MTDAWVRFAGGEGARELATDAPFVIGVIADLSGRGGRAAGKVGSLGFIDIDRDELDALFARCTPRIELALLGATPFELVLEGFDDLHPDRLAARIPSLAALLRAREVAHDARELGRRLGAAGVALEEASPTPALATGAGQHDAGRALLDEMLGGAKPAPLAPAPLKRADDAVAALVREIAERSSDGVDPVASAERRAAIDRELARRLRAVLGDARLRALEATWRALRDLVRAAETGERLRLRVLDASREDLAGARALEPILDGVFPEAEAPTSGARALIVCDLAFTLAPEDVALMERLASAAGRVGARVVANAAPALVDAGARGGLQSDAVWRALRERCGESLRLAGPRVLARLPYGAASDAIETFAFEECDEAHGAEALSWSGGAWLVARAFAACAAATGALASVAEFSQIEALPQVVARSGVAIGPAERVLRSDEREQLVRCDLIAVCAAPGADSVRLALGSVA